MLQSFKAFLLALINYALDCHDYLLHSATLFPHKNQAVCRARLIKKYHSIEKGLALPSPRPGFGRAKAFELAAELDLYLKVYGLDETAEVTLSVLEAYQSFNEACSTADQAFAACLKKLRHCTEVQGRLLGPGGEIGRAHV